MTTVWIGDFRTKQLQQFQNRKADAYLVADTAEYDWFINDALLQLPLISADRADVVIMLGFNDCVYSCVWKAFDINSIALNYANKVKTLIKDYEGFNFYICSVNPIEADYPFAEYTNGIIPQEVLNQKILQFNRRLKELCNSSYIDSHSYLTKAGFNTRDGIRFCYDTLAHLVNYITGQFKLNYSTLEPFMPRIAKKRNEDGSDALIPVAPEKDDESFLYWKNTANGGYNKYAAIQDGCVLPSSAGYAWGRFMEISGSTPKFKVSSLPSVQPSDSAIWYGSRVDGYERGTTPRLGAIICWSGGTHGYGQLGVVEEVSADGNTIVISFSRDVLNAASAPQYNPTLHFSLKILNGPDWFFGTGYDFQGFIYNPKISSNKASGTQDYVPKEQAMAAPNRYFSSSGPEMKINARYIWQYLGSRGWTLNAVAGMLGNMQTESTINPALVEKTSGVSWPTNTSASALEAYANAYYAKKGRFPGYGLVQWTSVEAKQWKNNKYISWCNARGLDPTDINSQLERIIYECEKGIQFGRTSAYPMTFKEFSVSTRSADYLGKAFLKNYERPANPNYTLRGQQAEYWYNFLLSYTPEVVAESAAPTLSLDSLKVDIISSSKVRASFIVRNATEGFYTLSDASNKQLLRNSLSVVTNKDGAKVVSFDCSNLIPNTRYTIKVEVTGPSEADKMNRSVTFTMPQDYPSPIIKLNLSSTDTNFPQDSFKLTTELNASWGYWKKNKHGYVVQLIVNGQCINEKTVTNLSKTLNFKLSTYFNGYKSKLGDTIQIGIRTWVTDNKGQKLFDSEAARTSNSICFLKQPIIAYLNKD